LRPEVKWTVARKRAVRENVTQRSHFEALDPERRAEGGLPLFHKYCTQPRPKISTNEDQEGFLNFQLEPGRIGRTGSVTCMIGTLCEGVIRSASPDEGASVLSGIHMRTPVELLVLELFVHRSIVGPKLPEAGVFGQMKMGPAYPLTGKEQPLPVPFGVETLSTRPGAQALLEAPKHSEAIQDAVAMAGQHFGKDRWQLEDFVGYRVCLTFPPIPSFGGINITLRYPD